jgi:hypothetical protein
MGPLNSQAWHCAMYFLKAERWYVTPSAATMGSAMSTYKKNNDQTVSVASSAAIRGRKGPLIMRVLSAFSAIYILLTEESGQWRGLLSGSTAGTTPGSAPTAIVPCGACWAWAGCG